MSDHAGDGPESIDGADLAAAVEAVTDRPDGPDADTARAVLDRVTEDGVVTREALQDEAAEVSKVVMTAESRTEFADGDLADAREAAASAPDLAVVAARLEEFEERFDGVQAACDSLGEQLQAAVEPVDDGPIYDAAARLAEVRSAATDVQGAADELGMELQEFQRWLGSRDHRYRDLADDLDALADSVDNLSNAVDWVADAADTDGETEPTAPGDASDAGDVLEEDPAVAWADTALRVRVLGLFLADVRAELDALERWDRGADVDDDRASDLAARVDDTETRCLALRDRLEDLARPGWRDRFDDDLASFDAALADVEPPVDWTAVQETLTTYRSRVGAVE